MHASELFVDIFGGVVAMKKGGKKYIIYVVSNSYVISNFYLEGVCKHKCGVISPEPHTVRIETDQST